MDSINQEYNALTLNTKYKDAVRRFKESDAVSAACRGLQEANLVLAAVSSKFHRITFFSVSARCHFSS